MELPKLCGCYRLKRHPIADLYYNYKKSFSIVLMALVDANYRIIIADVGAYGKNSDGGIFSNSVMGQALLNGKLSIPSNKTLPGANIALPCYRGRRIFPFE
ncbi:hypothetical protein NQ314_017562 [Rhamnusium bicolor]|uniref:DDE Tnp4 domain-containing protein n=1 Tax=Rhamnusium bicolor TaxID=1586634 RepID=A0AAV8WVH4_9CUCU|nr:hypothetical protein NQ314_017562 [Rhamnusium bicolor]